MLFGTTNKESMQETCNFTAAFLENCQKQGDLRWKFLDAIIKVLQNTDDLDRFLPNNGPRVQYVVSDSVLTLFNDKKGPYRPWETLWEEKQTDLVKKHIEVLFSYQGQRTHWRYLRRVADNVESARSCRGRPRSVCGPHFLSQHDERKTRRRWDDFWKSPRRIKRILPRHNYLLRPWRYRYVVA